MNAQEMARRLKQYPRPFRVTYFVDHYVLLDANGSEIKGAARLIEDSMNFLADTVIAIVEGK